MSEHEHEHEHDGQERRVISKAEYEGILKEMARDGARSTRERAVERAFGQDLPSLLRALHRKHSGNVSAIRREISGNDALEGTVSRPTVYSWLDKYEVRQ